MYACLRVGYWGQECRHTDALSTRFDSVTSTRCRGPSLSVRDFSTLTQRCMNLRASFTSSCSSLFFGSEQILDHIDATLHGNSPVAFGLHPNAEIGFRTVREAQTGGLLPNWRSPSKKVLIDA